jgi:hypothetical protein
MVAKIEAFVKLFMLLLYSASVIRISAKSPVRSKSEEGLARPWFLAKDGIPLIRLLGFKDPLKAISFSEELLSTKIDGGE